MINQFYFFLSFKENENTNSKDICTPSILCIIYNCQHIETTKVSTDR